MRTPQVPASWSRHGAKTERPRLSIELTLDNAAFDDAAGPGELARILQQLASRVELLEDLGAPLDDLDGLQLTDVNGNTVGRLTVAEVAPPPPKPRRRAPGVDVDWMGS